MRFNSSKPVPRGFTLVELLVTISVIGILAAISIPSVARSSGSHRVVEQTRRVHSDLVEARARAVAEQRVYRVQFFNGNSWRIQFEETPGVFAVLGATRTLPEGITLAVGGSPGETMVYNSHGRVQAPKTIVVVDQDGHDQRIDVGASGMIQWFANE